jgi:beta-1,4-mannosyltransferase
VEPYKGIEPVLDWWGGDVRATLVVAGKPLRANYADEIRKLAANKKNVRLELAWQSDDSLKRWLAAANCVVFHYRVILTSGAACLARSLGIPILIPRRLDTIDLAEPHPIVFRFDSLEIDFRDALEAALNAENDYAGAAAWREMTAWHRIAKETARVYRSVGWLSLQNRACRL